LGTVELCIPVASEHHDAVVAELEASAIGFLTEHDTLRAYFPAEGWSDAQTHALLAWLRERQWAAEIDTTFHADTNWNAQWESTVEPVTAGRFRIRPTWSDPDDPPEDVHDLIIDPKMSFGTGYHESTRLMLRLLPDVVAAGGRLLDVGTGTGVLSIAACRLGAAHCIAIDIDPNAVDNAPENARLNDVTDRIDVRKGSLDVVPESGFGAILANINRNVLHDMLPALAEKSVPGASLALAGLLRRDESAITDRAEACGFTVAAVVDENDWIAIRLEK